MSQRIYGPQLENGVRHFHAHRNPLEEFPALTHVHEARCTASHRLPLHIHETFEIVYIAAGRGQWRIENQIYALKPGDLLLIQPGELHDGHADAADPYTTFIVGFDPAALPFSRKSLPSSDEKSEGVSHLAQRKKQGVLVWDAPQRDLSDAAEQVRALDEALGCSNRRILPDAYGIEPIFRRLLAELDRPADKTPVERTLKALMVQAILVELLVFIARHQLEENQARSAPQRVTTPAFLAWLDTRLESPPTLGEMAAHAGFSVAHFTVCFKRETGLTPLEYLTRARIEAAATRLRAQRRASVTQIALDLGFSSPQYFCLVFQKIKCCSPSQWRSD